MNFKSFLKLVEIQTKVASVFPFALGSIYAWHRFEVFNATNFILMLISLLTFDMATTAINNYIDNRKAIKKYGFNYESHNAIVAYNLSEASVLSAILILLGIACTAGFILFLSTDIFVLLLGAVSFAVGVLYSFGPIPISRTPLGEIFSGLFMGFIIVFIASYIHVYDGGILEMAYTYNILQISVNIKEIAYIALISLPLVVGIANIMLANNICDIEDDLENRRYTLPIYIGRKNALRLFTVLYGIVFVDIMLMVVLEIIPAIVVVSLTITFPIVKNIGIFLKKQTKQETFVTAVQNFILIGSALSVTLALGTLINRIF